MKTVIADQMVFVGGSRVPAGVPFEVEDDAKLEPGMVEVEKPKAKSAKAESSEPQTLAEVAAADAKATEPKGAKGQARV
jgi:hypothetical protein